MGQNRKWLASFDHFIGLSEEHLPHVEAERIGGLEVDRQLDLGRPQEGCPATAYLWLLGLGDHLDRLAAAREDKTGCVPYGTCISALSSGIVSDEPLWPHWKKAMAQGAAKPRVERRLAAILAADVVGYSHLMGADEEGILDNRFLLKSLQDMHDSVVMLGRTIFAAPGRIAEALTEHQAIVAGYELRLSAMAEAARVGSQHPIDNRKELPNKK
jgi:hypothetical protein